MDDELEIEDVLEYTPDDAHHGHVMSVRTYVLVWLALMLLLVATVGAAYLDFGGLDRAVMLIIAVLKAALIMVYFMHLRHSSRLILIFALLGFFWIVILFLITLGDYIARNSLL